MTTLSNKPDGYITLKEASELFGYSPDYIGQLIRKGKIDGKQVYANVAWMTTKDSLEEYLAREKNSVKKDEKTLKEKAVRVMLSDQTTTLLGIFFRVLIPVLLFVLVIVFYFISVAIDHRLAQGAQERLDARMLEASAVTAGTITTQHMSYEK